MLPSVHDDDERFVPTMVVPTYVVYAHVVFSTLDTVSSCSSSIAAYKDAYTETTYVYPFLLGHAQKIFKGSLLHPLVGGALHCDPVSCYKGLGHGRVASYLDKFFNGECFAIFVLLALFDGQAQGRIVACDQRSFANSNMIHTFLFCLLALCKVMTSNFGQTLFWVLIDI